MNELQGLEKQLQDAKELVERRNMALKLANNTQFKRLILQDFVVEEMARLAGQAGDPVMGPKEQADCLEMAKAGGHLKRYLSVIVRMGNTAEADIGRIHDAIEEVRAAEDLDNPNALDASGGDPYGATLPDESGYDEDSMSLGV